MIQQVLAPFILVLPSTEEAFISIAVTFGVEFDSHSKESNNNDVSYDVYKTLLALNQVIKVWKTPFKSFP